jgi:DNA replication protein DnaC
MSEVMESPSAFLSQFGSQLAMVTGHCTTHGTADMLTRRGAAWTCPVCLDTALKAESDAITLAQRNADRMSGARIPTKYTGARFAASTDAQRAVLQTVQGFRDFILGQRNWAALVMAGKTGTGKTLVACQLAQSLIIRAALSVRYITAMGIVSEIQATYGRDGKSEESEIARFARYDVLIIDEIDALPDRENGKLLLTEIINRRYNDNKPVIVISNQPLAKLANFVGDRVHSRLYENSFPCDFSWEDFRRAGAASRGVLP